ncbi:predicted protein [Botrytis cinerea T4]|uniref:Uncharacterized protein n=1 Tax=Botryotinia fuckeliana (strain T4) TaxID=999810 RepID=G2Y9T2_BOTF4|nr:predicted protein [Botrytis cinerea T4]
MVQSAYDILFNKNTVSTGPVSTTPAVTRGKLFEWQKNSPLNSCRPHHSSTSYFSSSTSL